MNYKYGEDSIILPIITNVPVDNQILNYHFGQNCMSILINNSDERLIESQFFDNDTNVIDSLFKIYYLNHGKNTSFSDFPSKSCFYINWGDSTSTEMKHKTIDDLLRNYLFTLDYLMPNICELNKVQIDSVKNLYPLYVRLNLLTTVPPHLKQPELILTE